MPLKPGKPTAMGWKGRKIPDWTPCHLPKGSRWQSKKV